MTSGPPTGPVRTVLDSAQLADDGASGWTYDYDAVIGPLIEATAGLPSDQAADLSRGLRGIVAATSPDTSLAHWLDRLGDLVEAVMAARGDCELRIAFWTAGRPG
jgi:hypothetical protein